MTNEEFQKLVLEKLTGLGQGQAKLEQGQKILETKVENGLSSLAARLENVEGQLSETNGIVKALIHNTEELNAKYDGLLNITASKEVVDRIEKKIDKLIEIQVVQGESINILALRQLKTESEIEALKKAR